MTSLGILMIFLREFCVSSHAIDKKIAQIKAKNEQVGVTAWKSWQFTQPECYCA